MASGKKSSKRAAKLRITTIDVALAARLNTVVSDALRDYSRSREHRHSDYGPSKDLCDRMVNGIPGRAHGWCVDFKANGEHLVQAGLARTEWFEDAGVCKVLEFGQREIELFQLSPLEYELSIKYNDADCQRMG